MAPARRSPWIAPPQAVTELPFGGTSEAGSIGEAKILGDRRDRLCRRRICHHRVRFEQPLALNIPSDTSPAFVQAIETGPRHSNEPARSNRPESRCPQMLANDLPHSLLMTYIDLPPSDGEPLRRWDHRRRGDHRADRIGEAREVGLHHGR